MAGAAADDASGVRRAREIPVNLPSTFLLGQFMRRTRVKVHHEGLTADTDDKNSVSF